MGTEEVRQQIAGRIKAALERSTRRRYQMDLSALDLSSLMELELALRELEREYQLQARNALLKNGGVRRYLGRV